MAYLPKNWACRHVTRKIIPWRLANAAGQHRSKSRGRSSHNERLLTTLRKTRESLVHIFFSFGEHSYRLQELQELVQMSDEQLAARNLRREDIVHHIFSHQHVG